MTDNLENIAVRLRDFIHEVEMNASSRMPMMTRAMPRTGGPKEPMLVAYEQCLSKLTDAERGELDRIIQKMSGTFNSPPGAINPP